MKKITPLIFLLAVACTKETAVHHSPRPAEVSVVTNPVITQPSQKVRDSLELVLERKFGINHITRIGKEDSARTYQGCISCIPRAPSGNCGYGNYYANLSVGAFNTGFMVVYGYSAAGINDFDLNITGRADFDWTRGMTYYTGFYSGVTYGTATYHYEYGVNYNYSFAFTWNITPQSCLIHYHWTNLTGKI